MTDRPDGAELLAIARRSLLDELLSILPEDRRYTARMVANAMAIAARELEAGDDPRRAEVERLCVIYNVAPPVAGDRRTLEAASRRLNHRLAAEIRAGMLDAAGPRREAVRAHLLQTAIAKLRLSNPKYLASEELA
jgi:RNA polymerase-interacting CarD/CdnL/TRCF family regulator